MISTCKSEQKLINYETIYLFIEPKWLSISFNLWINSAQSLPTVHLKISANQVAKWSQSIFKVSVASDFASLQMIWLLERRERTKQYASLTFLTADYIFRFSKFLQFSTRFVPTFFLLLSFSCASWSSS